MLYRAATGQSPFAGKDTMSILHALATQDADTAAPDRPCPPRMFSGLVMRLLAKDPDDRPQSAREVVEAIEALERGEDASPPEDAPVPEARKGESAAPPPALRRGGRGDGGGVRTQEEGAQEGSPPPALRGGSDPRLRGTGALWCWRWG